MNLHRVKHIPTGLYYQTGKNNLSENGKIYYNNQDCISLIKNTQSLCLSMNKTSRIVKKYPELFKDWEDSKCFNNQIIKIIDISELEREEFKN